MVEIVDGPPMVSGEHQSDFKTMICESRFEDCSNFFGKANLLYFLRKLFDRPVSVALNFYDQLILCTEITLNSDIAIMRNCLKQVRNNLLERFVIGP